MFFSKQKYRKTPVNCVSLQQVWRPGTTIARCAWSDEGGNIRVEDEIFRLGGFSVGINWVGFAGDVATRIRRVSRYHWGHSRPARIGTHLDHYALPTWANGSLTGTTSQTKQLGFRKWASRRACPFFWPPIRMLSPRIWRLSLTLNANPDCESADADSWGLSRAA